MLARPNFFKTLTPIPKSSRMCPKTVSRMANSWEEILKTYLKKKQKKLDKLFNKKFTIHNEEDVIRITGSCETWDEAVRACLLVAKTGSKVHVVNDIDVTETEEAFMSPSHRDAIYESTPVLEDLYLDKKEPDVLIIGGGVIGCAIARELSKTTLDVLLVEKEYDVAIHASSRNDGMVHPGIDLRPGLLKSHLNKKGNAMFDKLAEELEVPFSRPGQYLCFDNKKSKPKALAALPYFKAAVAGGCHLVDGPELHMREPSLSREASFALFFPGAGIVCPFNLTIALGENAIENGVEISLNTKAHSMSLDDNFITGNHTIKEVHTNRGTIRPKLVINAAGVFTEEISKMAKDHFYSIHPRKGTSSILDKKSKVNINSIYSLLRDRDKSSHSKGGGVVSTVHGNVLVGPSAVEVREKEDFTTDRETLKEIMEKHGHSAPWMSQQDVIAYFSGIRAATYEEDFIIEMGRETSNILHVAGIQSPGLTAAPAIAEEVSKIALETLKDKVSIRTNPDFNPHRKAIVHSVSLSYDERQALIEKNPDYGQILCRCEEVSKGEILDAMRRPIPCKTLDGIKRRVRPTSGRCQGGFCTPAIIKLISQEFGIPMEEVSKGSHGTNILMGEKGGFHE